MVNGTHYTCNTNGTYNFYGLDKLNVPNSLPLYFLLGSFPLFMLNPGIEPTTCQAINFWNISNFSF
jgi:hypothetical protein